MPYSCMNTEASSGESWAISISSLPCSATDGVSNSQTGALCPSPMLKTISTGLRVSSPKLARILPSSAETSTFRRGIFSERASRRRWKRAVCRSLSALSVPPFLRSSVRRSSLRSTAIRSFRSSSLSMISASRAGSMLPIVCRTLSSSKPRVTSIKPSICVSWFRSWPEIPLFAAPLSRPAISA